jgi:small subunit ribosomal protein S3Ae
MPQQTQRKQWFTVQSPSYLDNSEIGDVRATTESDIIGRTITLNLSNVTDDKRKQDLEISFEVVGTDDGTGLTETKRVGMTEKAVNRMVRRGRTRVDASFPIESRDGKTLRIKPFIVTSGQVSNSVATALRHKSEEILESFLADHDAANFFEQVVTNTIQRQLKNDLSEITPLRYVGLRESVVE